MNSPNHLPLPHGLYHPENEHDSCGVGFVAHIKGERSHQNVLDAHTLLMAMEHRGGCGCEDNTGDGAGILTALPYEFITKVAKSELGKSLPEPGKFGAGVVFLPRDPAERQTCKEIVNQQIAEHGQQLVGWRDVPQASEEANVGPAARAAEPFIEMLIVAAQDGLEGDEFERQLYAIRKKSSHAIRIQGDLPQRKLFYVCSLSTKVIIYKGMLNTAQVVPYYPDLQDPDFKTHLAMVHSRFSTNTFPSWDRAQPFRFMSHNGEINTLRGNKNWMRAREGMMHSELFGESLPDLFPICEPDCSDSGTFDNALEFLLMCQAGHFKKPS